MSNKPLPQMTNKEFAFFFTLGALLVAAEFIATTPYGRKAPLSLTVTIIIASCLYVALGLLINRRIFPKSFLHK